ncbi:purine-cytosine permease family protein [Benzoatithermus flavus]|uniref:Allantoin permease n=1 Tax=Benzoatithermus flavus TaxID=3108223 RepID=A0ABU8XWX5_9PROT
MAGTVTDGKGASTDLDYASAAVPPDGRMPKGALTMAWWAVCSAMFYIVVAATLALNFGARNAMIGMALSVVAYGLINGVLSRYAIRTGLSVALFSRVLFGNIGAAIATLIFFATATYYAVFEGSVIAVALSHVFPSLGYELAALVVVLYSVALIFGSIQHWLDKLNGVLLPFYALGLLAAIVLTIATYGYSHAWLDMGPAGGAPANGWWSCFVYFMGVWILMMYTFDYARFGRKEDADYHARFNFGMPFYLVTFFLNGVAGIFLASSIPTEGALSEVSVVLALLQLMGIWGLVFVWVTQTRINTANFYLAAVNMESFFQLVAGLSFSRIVWAVVVGAIVYGLMLADVFGWILQALAYQGIFVVAWVAIALGHILLTRDGGVVEYRSDRVPAFDPNGLIAWFAAAAVGVVLLEAGGSFAGFSAPATAVVAGLVYLLLRSKARRGRLAGETA